MVLALTFPCLALAPVLFAAAHWCTWLQGLHTGAPLLSQVTSALYPEPSFLGVWIALMPLWEVLLCSLSPLIVIRVDLGIPTVTTKKQVLSHKQNDSYIKTQTGRWEV